MNDEELKATVGEAAFNAMSADQRTALLSKYAPPKTPKTDPKPDDESDDQDDEGDNEDLVNKAKRERAQADKEHGKIKRLESSISFNMRSADFLKSNEALLPKEVSDIFATADKETYADATEKADAIKAGLIQAFFAVQSNVDLLTAGQKSTLDDYLKLTKTGKQEKAQQIYDMVFEPAFETLKRVKKAEALRSGHGDGGDDAYKKRLMSGSRKHYLGEKNA
jgi:hypothetical protein